MLIPTTTFDIPTVVGCQYHVYKRNLSQVGGSSPHNNTLALQYGIWTAKLAATSWKQSGGYWLAQGNIIHQATQTRL